MRRFCGGGFEFAASLELVILISGASGSGALRMRAEAQLEQKDADKRQKSLRQARAHSSLAGATSVQLATRNDRFRRVLYALHLHLWHRLDSAWPTRELQKLVICLDGAERASCFGTRARRARALQTETPDTYLKPSLHLELVQLEQLGHANAVARNKVLVPAEAPLELAQLPLAEHCATAALARAGRLPLLDAFGHFRIYTLAGLANSTRTQVDHLELAPLGTQVRVGSGLILRTCLFEIKLVAALRLIVD